MPIYEYQCGKCGNLVEIFQQGREEKQPKCDGCGRRMKRVISQSAFVLKGSGWYVTDYPSTSRKAAMEAEKKGAAAPSTGKGTGKTTPKKPKKKGK